MGDITMEKEANRYPPELISVSNPGVILVLKLKDWTIPSKLVLDGLRVAIDD